MLQNPDQNPSYLILLIRIHKWNLESDLDSYHRRVFPCIPIARIFNRIQNRINFEITAGLPGSGSRSRSKLLTKRFGSAISVSAKKEGRNILTLGESTEVDNAHSPPLQLSLYTFKRFSRGVGYKLCQTFFQATMDSFIGNVRFCRFVQKTD